MRFKTRNFSCPNTLANIQEMMKKLTFTIIIFLILVTNSIAQTGETELYQELEKTEKELNFIYNKLTDSLNSIDKKALLISQKDWIKFNESNCNFRSLKESEGGVIANKMFIDCKIQSTKLRITELKNLLENGF